MGVKADVLPEGEWRGARGGGVRGGGVAATVLADSSNGADGLFVQTWTGSDAEFLLLLNIG